MCNALCYWTAHHTSGGRQEDVKAMAKCLHTCMAMQSKAQVLPTSLVPVPQSCADRFDLVMDPRTLSTMQMPTCQASGGSAAEIMNVRQ